VSRCEHVAVHLIVILPTLSLRALTSGWVRKKKIRSVEKIYRNWRAILSDGDITRRWCHIDVAFGAETELRAELGWLGSSRRVSCVRPDEGCCRSYR
jgi:hypothetical protein